LLNERFDPHTAKAQMACVAAARAFGVPGLESSPVTISVQLACTRRAGGPIRRMNR